MRNLESINNFTISLFEAGANDVVIVKRVKNDLEKHKADAVKKAVENARIRAEQIATTLGVNISQAIQVSELGEIDPDTVNTRNAWFNHNKLAATGAVHRASGVEDFQSLSAGPDLDIRKMKVSYRVIIQFEIK